MPALRFAVLVLVLTGGCRTRLADPDPDGGGARPVADGASALDLPLPCDASQVSGAPSKGTITCGAVGCPSGGGNVCCSNFQTPPFEKSCTQGGCPPGFSSFTCDGPEDCPGKICCFAGDAQKGQARCQLPCEGQVVCHAASDCPTGDACVAHSAFPDGTGLCSPARCP